MFGLEYKTLCRDIVLSAEYDELPMTLQLNDTFGLTFQDISDLYRDVKTDTGMELSARLFMCDECNMLHLTVEIDYPKEKEDEDIYLQ